jgi:hypothetical protein
MTEFKTEIDHDEYFKAVEEDKKVELQTEAEMEEKYINNVMKEKTAEEIKRAYNKKYYEKHKEKILTSIKEKKLCTHCGKMISASNFSKHKKNNKCLSAEDKEIKKSELKKKKIIELNDYITTMNNLYDTNVNLLELPEL